MSSASVSFCAPALPSAEEFSVTENSEMPRHYTGTEQTKKLLPHARHMHAFFCPR